MITQVRKIGNSLGHIIPMALVQQFGLVEGTKLNIQECNGAMMIEPIITKKFPFSEQEPLVQAHDPPGVDPGERPCGASGCQPFV